MTERHAGTIRIVCCDRCAAEGGVCHGMTLAEAKALLPALRLEPHDSHADRRTLEKLAAWAQAFSPTVHIEDHQTLLLDVTGCRRLFKGDHNLLAQAIGGLKERGFSARGAVADTPGAAWAIAHTHPEPVLVTRPERSVEDLLRLPVRALRIDERTVATLAAVGIETVEALMYLPRASLGARFGDTVLHRLDQALGNVPEPLTRFSPPPVLRSCLQLGAATDRRDIVHRAACHVLTLFCEQLAHRVVGVTRLYVTFRHPEADSTTVTVETSRCTRLLKRLQTLMTARLDSVGLPAETDGVMVWAAQVEPLDDWQDELFDTQTADHGDLSDLLDRLSMRLGPRSVARVALLSDHQPERAYACVPWNEERDGGTGPAEGPARRPSRSGGAGPPRSGTEENDLKLRPLQVWRRPVEVPVVAVAPEGPPSLFRLKSVEHPIVACTGPERLETGWWRGPHLQRDYFRVLSRSGETFWIFRDRHTARWFVHGMFD